MLYLLLDDNFDVVFIGTSWHEVNDYRCRHEIKRDIETCWNIVKLNSDNINRIIQLITYNNKDN